MVVQALEVADAAVTTSAVLSFPLAHRHLEGTWLLSVLGCASQELVPWRVAVGRRRPTAAAAAVAVVAAVAGSHFHSHSRCRPRS